MNILSTIAQLTLMLFIVLYPILPSFGKFNADLIIVLLAALQIITLIFCKDCRIKFFRSLKNIRRDYLLLSLIFFNATMYLSILVATNKNTALGYSIRFSMYLFVFFYITYNIRTKKQLSLLLNTLVITNFIIGFIALYQIIINFTTGTLIDESNRIYSTLENPNNFGAYTILSVFIVLSLIISCKNKKVNLFYYMVFVLQLISIISCQSRNALISIVIGSFILAIIYDKRYIIISIILPIILFLIPQSRLRVLEIFDISQNTSRLKLWKLTLLMIKDNPIFGIGYENYEFLYKPYVSKNMELRVWDGYQAYHPHNIFLKVQSELGIFGTISFILFIITTIILFYKLIKIENNKKTNTILIGIASSIFAFQLMNLIDSYYTSPKIVITMLVVLGIANAYKQNKITLSS